jgi:hypothetical protein
MKSLHLRLSPTTIERLLLAAIALLLIAFAAVLLVQPSAVGRGGR